MTPLPDIYFKVMNMSKNTCIRIQNNTAPTRVH